MKPTVPSPGTRVGSERLVGLENKSAMPPICKRSLDINWLSRTLLLRMVRIAILAGAVALAFAQAVQHAAKPTPTSKAGAEAGYVGSQVCGGCHSRIYRTYLQTAMGRSVSAVTPESFEKIPRTAKVLDPRSKHYFEIFAENGDFFQSEYERGPDGRDRFRDTHKLQWIIGAGANGFGAIVRRDDFLFEAPLSFYTKTGSWELSPGYEFADYGFTRAILPACIGCHSGRPQPIAEGNGRFREPPFSELAIGCENCHGPGAVHVAEGSEASIVNPAKLPSWLADNICMSCHQTGDARVLQAGKTFQDFRPGAPLDDTLAIFMVPLKRESPPQSDLLQHYFSMTLSKCYRLSRGQLRCIRCHDPHVEPTEQQAPDYYRQKCLTCHTEKSCAVPVSLRQHKNPPDHCAGCHMPKRDVGVISHAVLTNHRIIAEAEEPFPDAAFQGAVPPASGLVHLNAVPGKNDEPSPLTLLQAYGQLMTAHPEFRGRYIELAKQMGTSEASDFRVLEARALAALEGNSEQGTNQAIEYLGRAIAAGATSPQDYEQLGRLLSRTGRHREAVDVLQLGIKQTPYDGALYRLLAESYVGLKNPAEACSVLANALKTIPQDSGIRNLLEGCGK